MTGKLTIIKRKLGQVLRRSNFKAKDGLGKVVYVILKPTPIVHKLSREEQIYFQNLIKLIFGYNNQERNEKLKQLTSDYNVRLILPHLCNFIKDTICHAIRFNYTNITLLAYALRMVKSLLENKHINLKPHILKILPAVLSCGLSKTVSMYYTDNHWTLRKFAGVIVASICATYSDEWNNIKQRVINLYIKGIVDADKELTTAYGAIKGLQSLGAEAVKNHLIPRIMFVSEKIQKLLETNYQNLGFEEQNRKMYVIKRVQTAMVNGCAPILYETRNINEGGVTYTRDFGCLGTPLYIQVKIIESLVLLEEQIIAAFDE